MTLKQQWNFKTAAGFGSLFLVSYISIMLIWNVWEIVDPSQMKMTFHFFPKSGVLRKTSLTL